MTKIRMRGPWVLLKRIPTPEVTRGGIILPLIARELPPIATVLSHGPGIKLKKGGPLAPIYKIGDTVMYKKFEYRPFYFLEEDLIICHQSDIICLMVGW